MLRIYRKRVEQAASVAASSQERQLIPTLECKIPSFDAKTVSHSVKLPLASALCLLALRVPDALVHPSTSAGKGGLQTVISELLAGFRQIAITRALLVVVGTGLIALFGGGAITALNIVFVNQRLHASVSLYGPLAAISGLGIVVGAVLAGILATKVTPKTLLAGSVFLLGG